MFTLAAMHLVNFLKVTRLDLNIVVQLEATQRRQHSFLLLLPVLLLNRQQDDPDPQYDQYDGPQCNHDPLRRQVNPLVYHVDGLAIVRVGDKHPVLSHEYLTKAKRVIREFLFKIAWCPIFYLELGR